MNRTMANDTTEKSGQQLKEGQVTRSKRPRSSLACIRCRKKKVKCDFVQPTCGRCSIAELPCSYATLPKRVDGLAFDQLGSHVEELKERMQKMQNELAMMKYSLRSFPSQASLTESNAMIHSTASGMGDKAEFMDPITASRLPPGPMLARQQQQQQPSQLVSHLQQPITWKLSLSPSGLRIDTNIASVADLYRILLNGISQLNINQDANVSLFSTEALSGGSKSTNQDIRKNFGRTGHSWKRSTRALEAEAKAKSELGGSQVNGTGEKQRLWEVNDSEAQDIIRQQAKSHDMVPRQTMNHLIEHCYHNCFLAHQMINQAEFLQAYCTDTGIDPLLSNSINAWLSKHGCIFHNACPGEDPSVMGEIYFKNARQLLKKCFDMSSPTTIHALLNLYMYQLSSERSGLAYLYIGLAIRMAQDLKYHKKEHMSPDPIQRETTKRLWWSTYWLDLCAALETNRPTMADDKECDLDYPSKLDFESDETGYRVDFCVYSIKLLKIRKDITKHLPLEQSGQSLLSAISRLENALMTWLNELPQALRFEPEDVFERTGSFQDEARLILNIQYQTTWIMLHKFFLPKHNQTATPVALLSLNICTKSANFITKMLELYASQLPWCQFHYALDGVIASVTIHQANAISNEAPVAYLAQRHLITTSNVLKASPLLYMDKVNEIIDSIGGFLAKHNLPTDLDDLPVVNEDSIKQQSISSVVHPAEFESCSTIHMAHNPQTSPVPPHLTPDSTSQEWRSHTTTVEEVATLDVGSYTQSSLAARAIPSPQQQAVDKPPANTSSQPSHPTPQFVTDQQQDAMMTNILFQDPTSMSSVGLDQNMDQLFMGFDMQPVSEAFGQPNLMDGSFLETHGNGPSTATDAMATYMASGHPSFIPGFPSSSPLTNPPPPPPSQPLDPPQPPQQYPAYPSYLANQYPFLSQQGPSTCTPQPLFDHPPAAVTQTMEGFDLYGSMVLPQNSFPADFTQQVPTPDLSSSYASQATRKRAHREWDDGT